jgi:hypothetical protein
VIDAYIVCKSTLIDPSTDFLLFKKQSRRPDLLLRNNRGGQAAIVHRATFKFWKAVLEGHLQLGDARA